MIRCGVTGGRWFSIGPLIFDVRLPDRWTLARLATRLGVWDIYEGDLYRNGWFVWDFWNTAHSWWGWHYLDKHGVDAWAKKYAPRYPRWAERSWCSRN